MFHTADEFWMFGGSDGVGMVCRGGWLVVVKIETLSELQKSLLDNLGGWETTSMKNMKASKFHNIYYLKMGKVTGILNMKIASFSSSKN